MAQRTIVPLSDEYRRPIRLAMFQQILIAIVCLLMLDGGRAARFCGVLLLGFWLGAALIMARRPMTPTTLDTILIKYSFIPLCAAVGIVSQLIGR
jgi:hypothetical protein